MTPKAHTLSQPVGPLDGLILGTGFGAQFPAQIWDPVPCTSQKNGSEKESPFRTQNSGVQGSRSQIVGRNLGSKSGPRNQAWRGGGASGFFMPRALNQGRLHHLIIDVNSHG